MGKPQLGFLTHEPKEAMRVRLVSSGWRCCLRWGTLEGLVKGDIGQACIRHSAVLLGPTPQRQTRGNPIDFSCPPHTACRLGSTAHVAWQQVLIGWRHKPRNHIQHGSLATSWRDIISVDHTGLPASGAPCLCGCHAQDLFICKENTSFLIWIMQALLVTPLQEVWSSNQPSL